MQTRQGQARLCLWLGCSPSGPAAALVSPSAPAHSHSKQPGTPLTQCQVGCTPMYACAAGCWLAMGGAACSSGKQADLEHVGILAVPLTPNPPLRLFAHRGELPKPYGPGCSAQRRHSVPGRLQVGPHKFPLRCERIGGGGIGVSTPRNLASSDLVREVKAHRGWSHVVPPKHVSSREVPPRGSRSAPC